ncbi:MAG TPA: pyruvate kinase, partial [Firmicutes bacterium]|nr:pyruvate kinase [Bacillota bacterium]
LILRGQGVGRNFASGTVCIALTGGEAQSLRSGQILVARETDDSYMPVLGTAAAVITENSGLTSHAAIVGIELGIPVVVGAEGATGRMASGQTVTVDALRGLIYSGRVAVY